MKTGELKLPYELLARRIEKKDLALTGGEKYYEHWRSTTTH
jgi:hypothetical protein